MPEPVNIHCPYCGEAIELVVDTSVGSAAYVEDCPVCCRPMQVYIDVEGDAVSIEAKTGDE